MKKELSLHATIMIKKPKYVRGTKNKSFANLLKQDFRADSKNKIWGTDFYTESTLEEALSRYVFVWYNHIRPHSYNGGRTPFEARTNR